MMLPRSLPESPAIAGPEIFEYPQIVKLAAE
jgi:hypothetical protein